MVVGKSASGLAEGIFIRVGKLCTGADAIQQHAHADPGTRSLAKRVPELSANPIRVKEECLEVDARFGSTDRTKHRGEYLVAIVEKLHGVSFQR